MSQYLAFDLGASNGRCILGRFDGSRLELEVMHRFENYPVELHGHWFWDILKLYENIKTGLLRARREAPGGFAGFGLDTWGCDFALLDKAGKLAANPYCYRDPHTRGIYTEAFARVPKEEIFRQTGLQFMEPNSLFHLLALHIHDDPVLRIAATYLQIPDLLHYWLTGVIGCEYTDASTSQMLDAHSRDWAWPLIRGMGLPEQIFPPIIPTASILGPLRPALADELRLGKTPLIASATHDTASAVVATPTAGGRFGYLSSGTWGLLGTEIDAPLITPACLQYNFTNEGGAFNKIRLLRNIVNLWFVQECQRQWSLEDEQLSWDDLIGLASAAPAFTSLIDPNALEFLAPGNMPARIQAYCQRTGQPAPEDKGSLLRCVLESLAFEYRHTLEQLNEVTGEPLEAMHIIGGGSRNRLLNQFAADAMGIPVIAGPAEATAIGNILTQMVATGELASLEEARALVRASFETETFLPAPPAHAGWDAVYPRYLRLL